MKERPIIFNTEMVKAILEGRKTQTRRIVEPYEPINFKGQVQYQNKKGQWVNAKTVCPYGQVGDRLWVKESFRPSEDIKWKSPIFMPRQASRITLEITDVRVERLQEITESDAEDEGLQHCCNGQDCGCKGSAAISNFGMLWNSIHKKKKVSYIGDGTKNREIKIPSYAWEDNPWIWVITFKRRVR